MSEKQVKENPILEYCKYLIFERVKKVEIKRSAKYGGKAVFRSYQELENAFENGKLHPTDLKNAVSFYLNELIKPIREHFEKNKKAKELYETVKKFKVTR